jgi:hypothetical protein
VTRTSRGRPEAGTIVPRAGDAAVPAMRPRRPTLARFIGAAGMVALTLVLLWLLTDASFRVSGSRVSITGLVHADAADVLAHLDGLERSPNAFRVRVSELVGTLQELPEVASASAHVSLPGSVAIEVREREPIFVWSDGAAAFLVDREGVLFSPVEGEVAGLPMVVDGRQMERPWEPGAHLPATDLAVMRLLLTLTPEDLGSLSDSLQLRVDEQYGYMLESDRWQAVFGHYSPTLQPPDVVPRQVQCLTWLLADREPSLESITLAVSPTGCGTRTEVGRHD